jgi:hypothetical protein
MDRPLLWVGFVLRIEKVEVGIFFVENRENAVGFFCWVPGTVVCSGVDGICLHVNTRHLSDAATSALVCFSLFTAEPLISWR